MSKTSFVQKLERARPFLGIILQNFGYAGFSIISKFALNKGMSQHVLVVYRHLVAAVIMAPFAIMFDRKTRPKMTASIFTKIMLLALLEPVIDQNLFYSGMKLTTATFSAAMWNVVPAFTFIMAWILRLEKVDLRKIHSKAKVLGTIVTVGGAMVMIMVNGPAMNFPWTKGNVHQQTTHESSKPNSHHNFILGAIMIITGCLSWSCFVIVQAFTLKDYPAELSLTALICLMGAVEGVVPAIALEWGNPKAWAIHFDSKLLAVFYGGIVCSGFSYYIQGMVMKERGPVFVTAFTPLQLVLVAILSSFILSETMHLGMVVGATIIVVGLYMNLWGKSKDELIVQSKPTDKVLSAQTNDEYVVAMNANSKIQNNTQELVDIGGRKGTPGLFESV